MLKHFYFSPQKAEKISSNLRKISFMSTSHFNFCSGCKRCFCKILNLVVSLRMMPAQIWSSRLLRTTNFTRWREICKKNLTHCPQRATDMLSSTPKHWHFLLFTETPYCILNAILFSSKYLGFLPFISWIPVLFSNCLSYTEKSRLRSASWPQPSSSLRPLRLLLRLDLTG